MYIRYMYYTIRSVLLLMLLISCGGDVTINVQDQNTVKSGMQVQWGPPTTNADGSPLEDLAGFNVYYGSGSRNYTQRFDVGYVTSFSMNSLPTGTYYFAITAYDLSGNESTFSNEVVKIK